MVHNSFDWNFPEKKCLEIIHTTLINILKKQKDYRLPLNELIFMFNNRTKHHKIHQKKNLIILPNILKLTTDQLNNSLMIIASMVSLNKINNYIFIS